MMVQLAPTSYEDSESSEDSVNFKGSLLKKALDISPQGLRRSKLFLKLKFLLIFN
jgi:hypothetical protein